MTVRRSGLLNRAPRQGRRGFESHALRRFQPNGAGGRLGDLAWLISRSWLVRFQPLLFDAERKTGSRTAS